MRCPISFIPLSELEHPVVFRNQKALVVYDAEHLLTWLQTSRRNPLTNERLGPMIPLRDLLLPHRLPHTTDAQLVATRKLLVERGSVLEAVHASVAKGVVLVFNMLSMFLTTAWVTLILVVCNTVLTDMLHEMRDPVDGPWLEWMVRQHVEATVYMNQMYVSIFHNLVVSIIGIILDADSVSRGWCYALARVKAEPLFRNATGLGIDVLLTACK